MKPYYQENGVTIYHGDCLEVMPSLTASTIDCVIADLPYGTTSCAWDCKIDLAKLWDEYSRLVKESAVLCFTASQPFTSELVMSQPNWFRYEWIWKKNRASNFLNAKKQPLKQHESVLVFAPGAPRYFAQKTQGHVPINRAYRKASSSTVYRAHLDSVNNGGDTSRWPTSVIDIRCIDNISKERTHPTQKPVALYEYFIRTYTEPGDVVLDNCAGSGTAGVACRNTNRQAVLIEREEEFCEHAAKRLAQEVLQLG